MIEEGPIIDSKIWDITPNTLPLITLIGDPEENFYQLGIKDKQNHSDVVHHMNSQLKVFGPSFDYYLHKMCQGALAPKLKKGSIFSPLLNAYAEGLERPVEDIAMALLIPEILSGMGGIKKLNFVKKSKTLFGCSSFFALGSDQRPIHGRILDFPLFGSYNQYERAVLYQFKQCPQIFSLSSAGFPYPSLTAMTGNGVTLALHQKFNNIFNLKGKSIFEICFELLCETTTVESAIRFLRKQTSITAWGINMSFANGEVLLADLCGDDLVYKEINLHKAKTVYTNNLPIKNHISTTNPFPSGVVNYSVMRERVAIQKFRDLHLKGESSEEELLNLMARPLDQRGRSSCDYDLSPLTASSLTIATLRPSTGSCGLVADPAPRLLRQNYQHFENIWATPESRIVKIKSTKRNERKDLNNYYHGLKHFISAQTSMDLNDPHTAHHNIQMSFQFFDSGKYHERYLAQFYFLVFQFLYEKNKKVRFQILDQFKDLMPKVPKRFSEHCLLFIFRLEIILLETTRVKESDFKIDEFKKIYRLEKKIPRILLLSVLRKVIRPRLDIMDVVYLH